MISRRVIINLVAFFVIAGALVAYGAFTLLGNPFRDARQVEVAFDDASGLLPGFSASLDGVVVGTVSSVDLVEEDVVVTVDLDPGVTLPGDVEASVIRASAVGEQRVEFTPTDGGTAEPVPDGGRGPGGRGGHPTGDQRGPGHRQRPDHRPARRRPEHVGPRGRGRHPGTGGRAGGALVRHRHVQPGVPRARGRLPGAPPDLAPPARRPHRGGAGVPPGAANTAGVSGTLAERSQDLTDLMVNGAELAEVAGLLLQSQIGEPGMPLLRTSPT